MGVVYYANYLVWFECARVEWLRALGKSYANLEAEGVFLPVSKCNISYHGSARYDRPVTVRARLSRLTAARIAFSYEVIDEESGELLTTGSTTHAFTDASGNLIRKGPDSLDIES